MSALRKFVDKLGPVVLYREIRERLERGDGTK
jgi:hypothetical protein